MLRLIQHKILLHQGKTTNSTEEWESGLSAERIQAALRDWCADPLPSGYYRMTKPSQDMRLIADTFHFTANPKLPIEPHLRHLKLAIDSSVM